jgi:ribonuclease P protein component
VVARCCPAVAPRAAPASARKPTGPGGRHARLNTSGPTPADEGARLQRRVRIRQPAEFKKAFADGFRVNRAPLAVVCRPRREEGPASGTARLGLAIAKKAAPLAVDRNRIKRLIREHFRHNRGRLPAVDLVFYGQAGLAGLDNQQLRERLAEIWLKVIDRCAG